MLRLDKPCLCSFAPARLALVRNTQASISTHRLKKKKNKLGRSLKSQTIKTPRCLLAAQSHAVRGSEETHCTCRREAEACA